MPSNAAAPEWVTLTAGEEVRWDGHPSLRLVVPSIVLGFALIAAGAALAVVLDLEGVPQWLPLVLVPVGLLVVGWAYLVNRSTRYVITSEEVYRKRGLLGRDVAQIRLDRVQNTAVSQSFGQRLLSYGDVAIYTAGTDTMNIVLDDVPDPRRVNRILTEQLDAVAERSSRSDGL
ncbi:hypothetical protein BRC90_07465 [Halobacteriales archaeon QS_4_69_34]|nr:MAG: hypothetical protein BRC90_07465 [Halobacteriales archaeon QS_4_69_34]